MLDRHERRYQYTGMGTGYTFLDTYFLDGKTFAGKPTACYYLTEQGFTLREAKEYVDALPFIEIGVDVLRH